MYRTLLLALALPAVAASLAGCATTLRTVGHGPIRAVGAENQYANVISQIGGRYVSVTAIIDNPNADPHGLEVSPSVANAVSSAQLIVQNGLGYDAFMNRIESASPSSSRQVIQVQHLLGVPDSATNPHLWYSSRTPAALAAAVARALTRLSPRHAGYFEANAARFARSFRPWYRALANLRRHHAGIPVAVTEPVADYMLEGAGARVLTPDSLQLDVMNGVDPAPQNVTHQTELLDGRQVRAFLYNRQVSDSVTQSFLSQAATHHVPVVAVYETMPRGFDYQRWMLAEAKALERAVTTGASTRTL